FRANGWSLVRKIFRDVHGEEWHTTPHAGSTLGLLALTPSVIYSRCVVPMYGGFDGEGMCTIHGIAHITGGGVPEKMGRVLRPSGLGARLPNLFEPPAIVQYCQRAGDISDHDAYQAWNMGQGLAIITPEPDEVMRQAEQHGIHARLAGEIIPEPEIELTSRGSQESGKTLRFAV
ncbi:MAG: AIR synthase-related protein, partial [Patescibacteria group bacterium]